MTTSAIFMRMATETEPLVLAACGWDRAVSVVGHLMTPVGLYPERFQVRQFPTPAELSKLGVEDWGLPAGGA